MPEASISQALTMMKAVTKNEPSRQPRADCPHRYFEDRGHFLVGQAFEPDEEDRFALLGRQLLKSTLEIAQLQLCDRDRSRRHRWSLCQLDRDAFPDASAHIIDMLIVHDRE